MAEADYRTFTSNGNAICHKCHKTIGNKKVARALPPCDDSGRLSWSKIHCHPSCEESARLPNGPPDSRPRTRTFRSRYESTVCCLCNSFIEVGHMMEATIYPDQYPSWQDKKHHPNCPPGGTRAMVGSFAGSSGGGILFSDDFGCDDHDCYGDYEGEVYTYEDGGEGEEEEGEECAVCKVKINTDPCEPAMESPLGPVCRECGIELSGDDDEDGDECGDDRDGEVFKEDDGAADAAEDGDDDHDNGGKAVKEEDGSAGAEKNDEDDRDDDGKAIEEEEACDAPATPPPSRKRHRSEDGPSSSEEPAAAKSRVDPQGGPRAAGAGVAAATKLEFTDRESEVKLEEQGKPSSSEEPGAAGSRVNPQGESEAARAEAGVEAAKPEVSEVKQEEHGKDGTSRNLAASEGWEGPSAAALVKMEPPHTAG